MKTFLCTWCSNTDELRLSVDDSPYRALGRDQGKASPIFPLTRNTPKAQLRESGVLLLLFPRSTRDVVSTLTEELDPELADRIYLSHGHASTIVFLRASEECELITDRLADQLLAFEIWPYRDGAIDRSAINTVLLADEDEDWRSLSELDSSVVDYEGAAQIRQFNANLQLFAQIASRYMPESKELRKWLHESVSDILVSMRAAQAAENDDPQLISQSLRDESALIELNSVLTLYCSQLGSGCTPILTGRFPVGEYSLLGIGSMVRGVWRIYLHMSNAFARYCHAEQLQTIFINEPAFDPFAKDQVLRFEDWYGSSLSLSVADTVDPAGRRMHIPHFSSRWGFHETLHSISFSWQSLYASATREWNLLTFTHEFLHAHVRELTSKILDLGNEAAVNDLVKKFNARETGSNALESLRLAYLRGLLRLRNGELSTSLPSRDGTRDIRVERTISDGRVFDLMQQQGGIQTELIVHTLDFLYVYAGHVEAYVNSIWSSWSQIPSVSERIHHYLFRTLCAITTVDDGDSPRAVFDNAASKSLEVLQTLAERARSRPVIRSAITALQSDVDRDLLYKQFVFARPILHMTVAFLYDARINAELFDDDFTSIRGDRIAYAVSVGKFSRDPIGSPIGFLLDRFENYGDDADSVESEHEGLWQVLELT